MVALVRHHLICYDDSWSDAAVRRWLRRVTPELAPDLYQLNEADVRGKGRDASADLEALTKLKAHVERVLAAGAALGIRRGAFWSSPPHAATSSVAAAAAPTPSPTLSTFRRDGGWACVMSRY